MKMTQNIARALALTAIFAFCSNSHSQVIPVWGKSLAGSSIYHHIDYSEYPSPLAGYSYVLLFEDNGTYAHTWSTNYLPGDPRLTTKTILTNDNYGAFYDGTFWAQNQTPLPGGLDLFTYYWDFASDTRGTYNRCKIINGAFARGYEQGNYQTTAGAAPINLTNLSLTLQSQGTNSCKLNFVPTSSGISQEGWRWELGRYTITNLTGITGQKVLTGGDYEIKYANRSTLIISLIDKSNTVVNAALLWTSNQTFVYYGAEGTFDNGHIFTQNDMPRPTITMTKSGKNLILTYPAGVLYQSATVIGPFTKVTGASSPYTVDPSKAPMKLYILKAQ